MNKEQVLAAIENEVNSLMESEGIESLESLEVNFDDGEVNEIIVNGDYGIRTYLETKLSSEEIEIICNEILENKENN